MKMERVNSNQIKCYLNKSDLSARNLSFSEIAYGNPKTTSLFQDMMAKALEEFDFDMHNIPVMIEIVPVSYDSIMLIITKVDDPSDIDEKFLEFQENPSTNREGSNAPKDYEASKPKTPVFPDLGDYKRTDVSDVSFAYIFDSFEQVVSAAHELSKYRINESDLYREDQRYILLIKSRSTSKDLRLVISGLLSEFGTLYKNNLVSFEYYNEHCELIIANDAISQLARF